MVNELDIVSYSSLGISLFATAITLVRYRIESRAQREANIVAALYDIVQIIDNDRAVESRGLVREDEKLNKIRDLDPDTDAFALPELDEKTQEAARYIATTYDRLGFVLRHDPPLEKEILDWNGDVIGDMWLMTRSLIKKKLRVRNPNYAREFERIGKKALAMNIHG